MSWTAQQASRAALAGCFLIAGCGHWGAAQAPEREGVRAGPCAWRTCELDEGPLDCTATGQICDMFRNRCMPACEGPQCCEGVRCPAGSACAPAVGRCGVAAGPGCFDMGTTWWTGRDIPSERRQEPAKPSPVRIEVHNRGHAPIYFDSTWQQPLRFDLYQSTCGRERRLEIAENHFCPCPCPAEGPPRCRDCGRPPPSVRRLRPGERLRLAWSGSEEVWTRRICDKPQGEMCLASRPTLPGVYVLEVCAYTGVAGGPADKQDPDRLTQATPAGVRQCRRVEFRYPAASPVVIHFGR